MTNEIETIIHNFSFNGHGYQILWDGFQVLNITTDDDLDVPNPYYSQIVCAFLDSYLDEIAPRPSDTRKPFSDGESFNTP